MNAPYFHDGIEFPLPVCCLEDVLSRTPSKVNLVLAINAYDRSQLAPFADRIHLLVDRDCFTLNEDLNRKRFSYDFFLAHETELQAIYEQLADDVSRTFFAAYINQRISMDYHYLESIHHTHQYFEDDLIRLADGECFVDCGAYDGDTAAAFCAACGRQGVTYARIDSFEPDPVNYAKLTARGFARHHCHPKATSDHAGTLRFFVHDMSSHLAADGDTEVAVTTLDEELADVLVTYLKMDIEGAELATLRGAKTLIQKNQPKLAVCIYHRREDVWVIPQYLHRLVPSYRFYLRSYERMATELVLYAIPRTL